MSVTAVVGGQFGSEGKGLIVGHIAKDYDVHVRVGAANAGHTLYTWDGGQVDVAPGQWDKHVMQQLPCAAYANPDAVLCIGPGAQISAEIFESEIERLARWRDGYGLPWPQIYVDPRAHVVTDEHIWREQQSDLAERIGSTSTIAREGIGAAQAARVMREAGCVTADQVYGEGHRPRSLPPVHVTDVALYLARANNAGRSILLEGTQGTGLSLTTGFFPYTTSRNTTAAGLAADCGVAPNAIDKVIGVFRTYPIRVAGNSGPFYPDSVEIDWSDIGVDPESERTTVTKKVRRVATFSDSQLWEACQLNGVTDLALTFADYLPDIGQRESFAQGMERATGIPVRWAGVGPHDVVEREPVFARVA